MLKKQLFYLGLQENQSHVAPFLTMSHAALNKNVGKHKIKTLSAFFVLPVDFSVLLLACLRTCYA